MKRVPLPPQTQALPHAWTLQGCFHHAFVTFALSILPPSRGRPRRDVVPLSSTASDWRPLSFALSASFGFWSGSQVGRHDASSTTPFPDSPGPPPWPRRCGPFTSADFFPPDFSYHRDSFLLPPFKDAERSLLGQRIARFRKSACVPQNTPVSGSVRFASFLFFSLCSPCNEGDQPNYLTLGPAHCVHILEGSLFQICLKAHSSEMDIQDATEVPRLRSWPRRQFSLLLN